MNVVWFYNKLIYDEELSGEGILVNIGFCVDVGVGFDCTIE